MNNLNKSINSLNADLSNWQQLGNIREADKIKIKGSKGSAGGGKVTLSKAGVMQNSERALSKIFSDTLADAASTSKWIDEFQSKTWKKVSSLHEDIQKIDTSDPKSIENALTQLLEIRDAIEQSVVGLNTLSATYEKEHKGQQEIALHLQKNSTRSQAILIELDAQMSSLLEKLGYVQTSQDPKVEEQPHSAHSGISLVRDFVKGKGVDSQKENHLGADGKIYPIPLQFLKDLPRSPYVSLNDRLIYSQESGKHTIEGAYNALKTAFGQSENAVLAIMTLTTQGMFADPQLVIQDQHAYQYAPSKDKDIDFRYQIRIEGDKVLLTLKNSYLLRDVHNPENKPHPETGEVAPLKYQLVKREFTLSLKELKALDPNDEKKNLQTVRVKDSYSPVFEDHEFASRLYEIM